MGVVAAVLVVGVACDPSLLAVVAAGGVVGELGERTCSIKKQEDFEIYRDAECRTVSAIDTRLTSLDSLEYTAQSATSFVGWRNFDLADVGALHRMRSVTLTAHPALVDVLVGNAPLVAWSLDRGDYRTIDISLSPDDRVSGGETLSFSAREPLQLLRLTSSDGYEILELWMYETAVPLAVEIDGVSFRRILLQDTPTISAVEADRLAPHARILRISNPGEVLFEPAQYHASLIARGWEPALQLCECSDDVEGWDESCECTTWGELPTDGPFLLGE